MTRLCFAVVFGLMALHLGAAAARAQEVVAVAVPARAGAVDGTTENSDAFIWRLVTEFAAPASQRRAVACGLRNLGVGRRYLLDNPPLARAGRADEAASECARGGEGAGCPRVAGEPGRRSDRCALQGAGWCSGGRISDRRHADPLHRRASGAQPRAIRLHRQEQPEYPSRLGGRLCEVLQGRYAGGYP